MKRIRAVGGLETAFCLCLVFAGVLFAQPPRTAGIEDSGAPTISTFEAPGAGIGAGLGTWALGLNGAGVIAGYYYDGSSAVGGFVRAVDGTVTSFGTPGTLITLAEGINAAGTVAGSHGDSTGPVHGFVRPADGAFTSFDVPGGGTFFPQGTYAVSINAAGAVAGYYVDGKGLAHSFVRTAQAR